MTAPSHPVPVSIDIDKVLSAIEQYTGNDLSAYQPQVIRQAIYRRVQVLKYETVEEYCEFAQQNSRQESLNLQQIITSNVSDFFRQPRAFDAFKTWLYQYLAGHPINQPLRCWIAGCITGEEAYSLAICALEYYQHHKVPPDIHIIATDIDEANLTIARRGTYKKSDLRYLSPQRLQQFFIETEGGYQCTKQLRSMVCFTQHDILKNSVFINMNVVLCRNILYRFTPEAQARAFQIFHQALRNKGLLFTGEQDGLENYPQLFSKTSSNYAIAYNQPRTMLKEQQSSSHETHLLQVLSKLENLPSIIINASNEIVYLQGNLAPYLHTSADDFHLQACEFTDPSIITPLLKLISYSKQYPEQSNQRFIQFIHEQQRYHFILKTKAYTEKNSLYIVISFTPITPTEPQETTSTELKAPLLLEELHQSVLEKNEEKEGIMQKYDALFKSHVVGLMECSAQGVITEANPFICDLFNETRENMLGQYVCTFASEEYKDRVQYGLVEYANSTAKASSHIELEGCTKNGQRLWLEVSSFRLSKQNDNYHILTLVLDRTDRRQAQQLATAKHYELNRIMQANTATEVASTLAHELNQPLAAIQNYLTGCKNYLAHNPDIEKLSYAIEQASQQLTRASNIIKHVKAYNSSDHTVALSRHFLNQLINDVTDLIAQMPSGQVIHFELDLDPSLHEQLLNPTQIEQLLINLINNASRASQQADPDATSHTITIRTYQKAKDMMVVEVIDAGVGLPHTQNIFRPFFSENKNNGGMGIGLSICRSIVEAHGGQIEAFNNPPPHRGATVQFTLPLADH